MLSSGECKSNIPIYMQTAAVRQCNIAGNPRFQPSVVSASRIRQYWRNKLHVHGRLYLACLRKKNPLFIIFFPLFDVSVLDLFCTLMIYVVNAAESDNRELIDCGVVCGRRLMCCRRPFPLLPPRPPRPPASPPTASPS